MEIGGGEGQVGGEGAVVVFEAQDPALAAMPAQPPAAEVAGPAADIDFPHHPLSQPGGILGSGHLPHEFMTHDAPEVVIAPQDLEVGAADPRQMHLDQDFARAGFGPG